MSSLLSTIEENKGNLGRYYYLFRLQCVSGCRITEALNVDYLDIADNGSVLIKGLKGSNDRVIFDSELASYFLRYRISEVNPFVLMNRFTAYRNLKRLGIGIAKKGRKKASITHVFRNEYIRYSKQLTSNKATIAQSVGHKSTKSQDHYGE